MTTIDVVFDPPLATDPPAVFDAKAQDLGLKLNPFSGQANALAQGVSSAAQSAAQSVLAAGVAADDAETAADYAAAQADLAAQAADGVAVTWVAGGDYPLNKVVWGDETGGARFRCIVPHSGISTPPVNDPVHWVLVGPGSSAPSPTAGPTNITLTRDGNGVLTGSTFVQDSKNGTEVLTRDVQGRIATRKVVWGGKTRTETITRDPTTGNVTKIDATEV